MQNVEIKKKQHHNLKNIDHSDLIPSAWVQYIRITIQNIKVLSLTTWAGDAHKENDQKVAWKLYVGVT